MARGRLIGAVMVFGGAIVTALDVVADNVRGVNNYFSNAQVSLALVSLLIVIVGGVILLATADMSDRNSTW